jgi:hypothetical protein
MKQRYFLPSVFLLIFLLLTSCNLPARQTETREADMILTQAAQTVEVQLTQGVIARSPGPSLPTNTFGAATQELGNTPLPQDTNTPLGPTNTPATCDRAEFVSDVTIPDGTIFAPGEEFTKTWRIKNNGTCAWTTEYAVIFDSENMMGAASSVFLSGNVSPGDTVDISVDMKAPATPGEYQGNWKLRNASGVIFGIGTDADQAFYVEIEVTQPVFAVTGVYGSVSPGHWEAPCSPATLNFSANIVTNAAGMVAYHWIFSDAPNTTAVQIDYNEAGSKTVTYSLDLTKVAGDYSGWGAIYIDEPNHQEFSHIDYTLTCQ